MPGANCRWSDDKLEEFHTEFIAHTRAFSKHTKHEEEDEVRQRELHDLIFRVEDAETGKPPGLLQLTTRLSKQLHDMQVWQDRQRTFIGGVVFTFTSMWFFMTDVAEKLGKLIKAIAS